MSNGPLVVRVTEIGEYIHHRSCERRFKLGFNNRELAKQLPFAERLFNPLDPVLQEVGRCRENAWERSLRDAGLTALSRYDQCPPEHQATGWDEFVDRLQALAPGETAYAREVAVTGQLGAFQIEGRIDFILVLWDAGQPRLRLVECKASRRDRTYHRIQVALYRLLAQQLLKTNAVMAGGRYLTPDLVECVVVRIDESTNESQNILQLAPLNLEMETADITRLLSEDGALSYILSTDLDRLSYQIDAKCDGCVFNVHCLPESARQRKLAMLGIEPSTIRALQTAGIKTIDDLADLDPAGPQASQVRQAHGFAENLGLLAARAQARRRTLPGGDAHPDTYEVESLPHSWQSQLPEHEIDGRQLVRVYLCVDYDYTENRIGALSAHVTTSPRSLYSGFHEVEGRWRPDPVVKERWESGRDAEGHPVYQERPICGKEVIRFKTSPWAGASHEDSGAEREIIQGFLHELVDAIAEVAETDEAPIHFYVWSRSEVAQLVEGCSRASSQLLGHLRELLGCREPLEQLIYSCLQDEISSRYALGWTGQGLVVVTSLRWFGQRYHWNRRIAGTTVDLERAFTQDLFDFKTDLDLGPDGNWAETAGADTTRHKFEVRSRFHDSLPAPYWHAVWRTLPDPASTDLPHNVRNAIRRYNEAAKPLHLREYLRARTHALRWVEERVRYKNGEIAKPVMRIADLPDFTLGIENVAQAAIDFLRLDHHVKVTDWLAAHLVPPANRVPLGRTIPVRQVIAHGRNQLTAEIALDSYDIAQSELEARSTIGEGSFVRLSPCAEDPHRGQTLRQLTRGGKTCLVDNINWDTGQVSLSAIPGGESRYTLLSTGANDEENVFDHATLDENVSDFVAGRVDRKLRDHRGAHVYRWFDPQSPQVPPRPPLREERRGLYQAFLEGLQLHDGNHLAADQIDAAIAGLDTRVQLLQGPPGTGKTTTTAVAILLRSLAKRAPGDIVLVAAHTHTAVDTLLQRLDINLDTFRRRANEVGLPLPRIKLLKVYSSQPDPPVGGRITGFSSQPCAQFVKRERRDAILIVGGTTSAILKMAQELSMRQPFVSDPNGFQVPALIVDEASMMVLPHFLALASLVQQDGELMLSGDHRQLAPIVAHEWEKEDRPPVVLYQPFASAYDAIRGLAQNQEITEHAIRLSALRFTFRLPPVIRSLIARLYRLDNIELVGLSISEQTTTDVPEGPWTHVWCGETGLYLVVHTERESQQSNEIEARIIEHILSAAGPLPENSIAVMTPHRAQRSLLKMRLEPFGGPVDIIDAVERLQGGERPTVIVSATVSDPSAIAANVEFILDLNRSNVAFSRTRNRLIVICPDTLLDHIPIEVEHYESAMLWKSLRSLCSVELARTDLFGHTVRVLTPATETIADVNAQPG